VSRAATAQQRPLTGPIPMTPSGAKLTGGRADGRKSEMGGKPNLHALAFANGHAD